MAFKPFSSGIYLFKIILNMKPFIIYMKIIWLCQKLTLLSFSKYQYLQGILWGLDSTCICKECILERNPQSNANLIFLRSDCWYLPSSALERGRWEIETCKKRGGRAGGREEVRGETERERERKDFVLLYLYLFVLALFHFIYFLIFMLLINVSKSFWKEREVLYLYTCNVFHKGDVFYTRSLFIRMSLTWP